MTDTHNTIQRPDLKGRINLGEIANNVRSYRVTVASDGKWKMENGKWKMENGKWKMENRKWKSYARTICRNSFIREMDISR